MTRWGNEASADGRADRRRGIFKVIMQRGRHFHNHLNYIPNDPKLRIYLLNVSKEEVFRTI